MPALRSCSARLCAVASFFAFSVVYWSAGSTRSVGGAASAAPPVKITNARMAATKRLFLKNLLLGHGDRLAPPTLVASERDVLARNLGCGPFGVAQREVHVLA